MTVAMTVALQAFVFCSLEENLAYLKNFFQNRVVINPRDCFHEKNNKNAV